ncbi:MAG: prephenate dehydrogenase/arogenate dehydrogenase family protein, partial [Proteobacteria bacterium]|nr:prephenate dehydrogenase/arogenate dehydrogenase family protein [Pseudomonadota bacterium]
RMEPGHHDRVLAIVSHLPHLIAFTICNTADHLEQEAKEQVMDYAASGFRDFTRIASSSPEMWRDICLANREALLEQIEAYQTELNSLRDLLKKHDGEALERAFSQARGMREDWLKKRLDYRNILTIKKE